MVLLTSIFVVLAAVFGVYAISNVVGTGEAQRLLDADGNATTQYVTISHRGGETLRTADLDVIVRGETRVRYDLESFTQRDGDDTSRFEPGDGWRHPNGVDGSRLTYLLIHEPSNTVVDRVAVDVVVTIAARFSTSPDQPTQGETITFDAGGSEVRGSTLTSYEWDFGADGSVDATGLTTTRSYADDGTYPVSLTVTAADGRNTTRTTDLEVFNERPTASFTANRTLVGPEDAISFDGSGSTDDSAISSYAWDFADGTTATGMTASHAYGSTGNYTVNLAVTDDDGAVDSATRVITVRQDFFGASITSTNSPVTEGDQLDVAVEVSNTGVATGTQNVRLSINGTQEDSQSVTLDPGESTTITLSWATVQGDSQSDPYLATVATDNSTDSTFVSVLEEQAILQITDVNGLENQTFPHDYQPTVDIEEVNDIETENLDVRLAIENQAGLEVFNTSQSLAEIRNEPTTAGFDVGRLQPGTYSYTVTADADNAQSVASTESFVVNGSFTNVLISDLRANEQNTAQTASFTLEGDLSGGETVTIDLSQAQAGVVDYQSATVTTSGASFTTQSPSSAVITYNAGSGGDSDGSTIDLSISGVATEQITAGGNSRQYTVDFDRSDGEPTSATMTVSKSNNNNNNSGNSNN